VTAQSEQVHRLSFESPTDVPPVDERHSREEMQSILSTIPAFVLRVGLDGRIDYINRTSPGTTMDQLIGSPLSNWIHPEDRPAFQKVIDEVVATGKTGVIATRGARNGWRFYTRIGPVVQDGRVTSLIVVGEDVTDRLRVEEALRASSEEIVRAGARFHSLVEASPVPFALNDERHNITYLNPEFVRTFGYTLADIPTLADWWPRAHPDPVYRERIAAEWEKRLEAARASGGAFEPMELEIRAKDGSIRNVIASATSLTETFAGTHLVVLYDVTKPRQLEAERRKLEERLAHVQRMQSIGRLVSGVAHDNNNMLSVILSHTEIALRHIEPSHRVHADLTAIRQAAERSANLTKQLLAHARQQPITPVVLDLRDLVMRGMALLHRLLGDNVSTTVNVDPQVWLIRVDPTQVNQVLTNLCVNARDAIRGTGHIVVTVDNVVWSEAEARAHGASSPGEFVRLSVKDDGCGMSPEVLAQAFEPFFTTKAEGEGTGLGLATVLGIVAQNDGFIHVDSSPGRGTTFRVHFPRLREASH
jgi:PAS domain S-box-containing protein